MAAGVRATTACSADNACRPASGGLWQQRYEVNTRTALALLTLTRYRGIPRCNITLANGFSAALPSLCPALLDQPVPSSDSVSLRVTGSLTPSGQGWRRFGVLTSPWAWLRLWVDDHRLIDEWSPMHNSSSDGSSLPNPVKCTGSERISHPLTVAPSRTLSILSDPDCMPTRYTSHA